MLKISVEKKGQSVAPTVENTLNKSYPLARSLHFYTLGEPAGVVKKFIDWALAGDGQRIMEESGYVPVKMAAAIE